MCTYTYILSTNQYYKIAKTYSRRRIYIFHMYVQGVAPKFSLKGKGGWFSEVLLSNS